MRKDRIKHKDGENWTNVDNVQDFRLLDISYTEKIDKKVKDKYYTIPAKQCSEIRKKTLEMRRHLKRLLS